MKKNFTYYIFSLLVVSALGLTKLQAQINISVGNTVTENFDGIGVSAMATLPTGWKMSKNNTVRSVDAYNSAATATERLAGDNMANNAQNGMYNFGAGDPSSATDRALGGISSGSASKSVNIYVDLYNNGVGAINDFSISYNVEKYRDGTNAAGFSIQMYYSTDGSTWTSAGNDFLTSFAGSDPANAGFTPAPGATVSVSGKTLNVSLAASSHLYLAWNYSVTTGTITSNAQALGIDDVGITANGTPPCSTPTLSATITNATYGSNNGAIDLAVTGGTAPFTYSWLALSSSCVTDGDCGASLPYCDVGTLKCSGNYEDLSNLAPGDYAVSVTASGSGTCVATATYTVEELKVKNVDKNKYYLTIQEAIDDAANGHEIKVYAGTYTENVIIDKSVIINGAANHASIINGDGSGVVVTISSDDVTLNGFKIINSGSTTQQDGAIILFNSTNPLAGLSGVKISNNLIDGTLNGVGVIGGTNNEISGNEIKNTNEYGVVLIASNKNTIQDNEFENITKIAINVENGEYLNPSFITEGSKENNILDNTISNVGTEGVFVGRNCKDNIITDNSIEGVDGGTSGNGRGIYIWFADNPEIKNNEVKNAHHGIVLRSVKVGLILGNRVNGNTVGIDLRGENGQGNPCENITITINDLSGNSLFCIKGDHPDQLGEIVVATCNWYGSAVQSAFEDKISDNVVFIPYLITDDLDNPECLSGSVTVWDGPIQLSAHATIQAGVDAAQNGNEVRVAAGTFTESVTIPVGKVLTIKGANAGVAAGNNPGIRGAESILDGGLYVRSGSTIDGFTIKNGSYSGSIKNCVTVANNNVTVKNCIIQDVSGSQNNGIETQGTNNFTLENSTIKNNWRGLYLNPGSGHIFTGNLIDANNGIGVGIGSDGLSNFTMTGNTISNHTLEGWGTSSVGLNVKANQNQFLDNGLHIANYGGNEINATCNWYGTTNETEIKDKIQGDVRYFPYKTDAGPDSCLKPSFKLNIKKSGN